MSGAVTGQRAGEALPWTPPCETCGEAVDPNDPTTAKILGYVERDGRPVVARGVLFRHPKRTGSDGFATAECARPQRPREAWSCRNCSNGPCEERCIAPALASPVDKFAPSDDPKTTAQLTAILAPRKMEEELRTNEARPGMCQEPDCESQATYTNDRYCCTHRRCLKCNEPCNGDLKPGADREKACKPWGSCASQQSDLDRELPQRQAWRAFVDVFRRCWCGNAVEGTAAWAIEHVRCIPDLPRTEPASTGPEVLR